MILFIISIAWFAFLVHFLWRIGKIYFAREILEHKGHQDISDFPFISVIVPARNEETNIEKCVRSIAAQSYPAEKYEIIVVDDNSTDQTAPIVKKIMTDHANVSLLSAGPLPDGWAGKNNACWQGTRKAVGDWFCFMDADTTADSELLLNAIRFSEKKQIDMLSINPFQELLSCTERLFMPGVFLSIASTMNFDRVNDPLTPESGANGQFMLFRKTTYDAIGGHETIRSKIMEDMALAELVKKSGFHLYWLFGDKLVRTRMYSHFSHIWEGLSKNMMDIMKDTGKTEPLARAFSSLLLGWMPLVMPVLAWGDWVVSGPSLMNVITLGISLTATVSFFSFYFLTLMALNVSPGYLLSFPLGFTLHAALTINSMRSLIRGKRRWKGRIYDSNNS